MSCVSVSWLLQEPPQQVAAQRQLVFQSQRPLAGQGPPRSGQRRPGGVQPGQRHPAEEGGGQRYLEQVRGVSPRCSPWGCVRLSTSHESVTSYKRTQRESFFAGICRRAPPSGLHRCLFIRSLVFSSTPAPHTVLTYPPPPRLFYLLYFHGDAAAGPAFVRWAHQVAALRERQAK